MLELYPDIVVSFTFKNRSFKSHVYSEKAYTLLQSKIDQLDNLSVTVQELNWYAI